MIGATPLGMLGAAILAQPPQTESRYTLRLLGDPSLKVICRPVDLERDGDVLLRLVADLKAIAGKHRGMGLSANQVGSDLRLFVAMVGGDEHYTVFINPVVFGPRGDLVNCPAEGCLSIPEFRTSTKRHQFISVRWMNLVGLWTDRTFHGERAQVVQHELDHLQGRLIVDGVSRPQRREAERLVAKYLDGAR